MELLKKQKLSFFQDYKDKFMTREDYIVKKEEIDKTVKDLEERLNEVDSVQLLTNNKLTKQIVSTHIEKVVVDCLGFFTVIYK